LNKKDYKMLIDDDWNTDMYETDDNKTVEYNICKHIEIIKSINGSFCVHCGLVVENCEYDTMTTQFTQCGNVENPFSSNQLTTKILRKKNESNDMKMIQKMSMWTRVSYADKSMSESLDKIKLIGEEMGICYNMILDAQILFKHVREKCIEEKSKFSCRGPNREGFYCACLFHICKDNNIPRTVKEFSKTIKLKTKVISKFIKDIEKYHTTNKYALKCSDLLLRYSNILSIKQEDIMKLINISYILENDVEFYNNTPQSICAGLLYSYDNKIKQELVEVCNVSPVTIDKIEKKIKNKLKNN
jgi:transcription initiation factor TFIIIB Brf1 subunit/transcription initiation factor TFIIB